MSLLPVTTDFSDKDFDALRARLFALLQSVFPTWTDQNAANFGNILVEMYAFIGDVLTFYADAGARESRIVTATQRRNLIALCKLLNYSPSTASAASADVVLSIDSISPANVSIPAGTLVQTEDVTGSINFYTEIPATILAGALSTMVACRNAEAFQDTFTSSGLANQELTLSATPYIDNSATIVAGNGTFTQVAHFLDSTSTDRHFTVVVDQNDRAIVRFGNGINGTIPTGTIIVNYEVGGGEEGDVEPGMISKIPGTWTDDLSNPVDLSVTNPDKASGGSNRQSNQQIKRIAPLTIRVPINSVTKEDFEINALRVPGIVRALANTSNEDASVPENTTILYPIPSGGGVPSSLLKASVLTMVTETYPPTTTHKVLVYDPTYATANVTATVFLTKGYSRATTRANIEASLQTFFSPTNADGTPNELVDFGANMVDADGDVSSLVAWSDIFNAVRDSAGVRKVDPSSTGFLVNGLRADLTIEPKEFPALGTITLYDGDTGDAF